MKVIPLGNRILVEKESVETQTKGGLYIPQSAKEKTMKAEVLEIGSSEEIPSSIKIGSKIIFDKYAGTQIISSNESLVVLDISSVLAIIEED